MDDLDAHLERLETKDKILEQEQTINKLSAEVELMGLEIAELVEKRDTAMVNSLRLSDYKESSAEALKKLAKAVRKNGYHGPTVARCLEKIAGGDFSLKGDGYDFS